MSGLPVGIGVFDYTLNKFYDKIPNAAFSGETYKKPLKTLKRNSVSSQDSRRRDSRDDSNNNNNENNRSRQYRGAAAGAAGGYAADELYDDYRQPAPRRRSEDDERNYNYNNQDYEPDPNSYSQGDPNFGRRNRSQTLDGQKENDNGGRNRGMSRQDQQQQQYYAAPRTNDYHRYNPRDYEPQQQGYNSDYAPARYNNQQDPYDRPQTAGPRDDRGERREYREGRERRKSRSRQQRSKSSSPEGVRGYNNVRGMMKKNFEMSDTGLTSGALGAIAGGLIGNEVGKGVVSTIAGALIGGLGANAWEARDHRKQIESREERRQKDKRNKRDDSRRGGSEYDDRYQPQNPNGPNAAYNNAYVRQQSQGRGPTLEQVQGQRGGDDPEDSDEARRQRKEARRLRRAAKEEMKRRAEMGDGSLPWGDVLHT